MPKSSIRTMMVAAAVGGLCATAPLAQHGGPVHGPAPGPTSIGVPAGGTSVPMLDFGGRPVVEVMINGKGPYRFILDTGAHVSVVDTSIDEELALAGAMGVRAASPDGGQGPKVVTLDVLRVGDASVGGLISAVMPLHQLLTGENAPRGVLSASSFPGYLVTFDYPGKRISIKEGSLDSADALSSFEYQASDSLPTVPVEVAGRSTRVHLDTGSGGGLTLPARFLEELPLASEPKVVGKARTPSGEAPISRARVDGPIRMGGFTLDLEEVSFSDVAPGPVPPTGQIGFEVLRDFVLTFDSKNRRFRFDRAAPAAVPTPASP